MRGQIVSKTRSATWLSQKRQNKKNTQENKDKNKTLK